MNNQVKNEKGPESAQKVWDEMKLLFQSAVKDEKPVRVRAMQDLFESAIGMAEDNQGTLNLKIASTALKELRLSFNMFYPHRFTPKITIFGSARVPEKTPLYEMAKEFAEEAVKHEFMIMTGGGPGIMAAGNEGAKAEGGFGLNILLPMEQDANAFIDNENMLLSYKYFFTRKLFMVKEATAFAFFPGGFGTFDEAFEVLTLLQTGKMNMIPIVLVEPKGFDYWGRFMDFIENALGKKGFISPGDTDLFRIFHSSSEAVEHIVAFYKNFHSMRYVKDTLVLRLHQTPTAEVMKELNQKFRSILVDGDFTVSEPLAQERNEPELNQYPRVIGKFDRRDFGALRRLIDFLNENTV